MIASVRKALTQVHAERQRQLTLVTRVHRPLLDLHRSLYDASAPAIREYRRAMEGERRQALRDAASARPPAQALGPFPPGTMPFAEVMRIDLPGPYLRVDEVSRITGERGTTYTPSGLDAGATLQQVGPGFMTVVQQLGVAFSSQDAGPTEVVVGANITGSAQLEVLVNVASAYAGVQLIVDKGPAATRVASSAVVPHYDRWLFGGRLTQPAGAKPSMAVVFNRTAGTDYHFWLRFVFCASCHFGSQLPCHALLDQQVTIVSPGFSVFLQ